MDIYPSGSIIGNRYEVVQGPKEKPSLAGGMGFVYLCIDRDENRPVALKTFQPRFLPDRTARDRFLREGTAWVGLGKHPNIVQCYEIERSSDGREVYLLLELVAMEQGHQDASLRSWLIPGQALPIKQALLFALQIARGMKHATETIPGFVHRDLKPENILVGADKLSSLETNRLRVTDFGLANILPVDNKELIENNNEDITISLNRTQLTHGIVGTPLYMAPEQWQGDDIGIWTDIYALGCILHEMLTGQLAVSGRNLKELEQAHCYGEIQSLPTSLPETVNNIIEKCLQLEYGQRYQTWNELEISLGNIWEQVSSHSLPQVENSQKLGREERIVLGWSYKSIGNAYIDIGKFDVAKKHFDQAIQISKEVNEHALEIVGLVSLGDAFRNRGEFQHAIELFNQVVKKGKGSSASYGGALNGLGITYKDMSDYPRAIEYSERFLSFARDIGNKKDEGVALMGIGNILQRQGNHVQAIKYLKQALSIFRETNYRKEEGYTLNNLGNSYRSSGDIKQALKNFEKALEIKQEVGDIQGEANSIGNLGLVYSDLGNSKRAIMFYEQQLKITESIGDNIGKANATFCLAVAYHEAGDKEKAFSFSKYSEKISEQLGNQEYIERAQRIITELQNNKMSINMTKQQKDVMAALQAFQQAESISDMKDTAELHPMIKEQYFILLVEEVIRKKVSSEHKPSWEKQLAWLREISNKKQSGLFGRLFGRKR